MPTLTTLVSFTHHEALSSGLTTDAAGNLFGMTLFGGANGQGTVFEIPKTASGYASTPATVTSFGGADKSQAPQGGLITDATGNLFGTTLGGYGTVFEITKTDGRYANTPTTLVSFSGTNGAVPFGGLMADAAGDLFGTTEGYGANVPGTAFEIPKTTGGHANTPTVLASFNSTPQTGLTADATGNLFGMTTYGGANRSGMVFEIAKTGSGYASTPAILGSFNGADGAYPFSEHLIIDATGDLFGTTTGGGANDLGTVFELTKTDGIYDNVPTTLISFNGLNGSVPDAGLIADAAGNLFGTTESGGANGRGTVFEITKNGNGYASTPITLFSFNGTDGGGPFNGLIADTSGNLFGVTRSLDGAGANPHISH